jgi:hypothetical protein
MFSHTGAGGAVARQLHVVTLLLGLQICDETLGALAYMLKRDAELPPGPIFTARLEVDYKKVCQHTADRAVVP